MVKPARLLLRLVLNTALGFLALWLINLAGGALGLTLGFNLLNAVTVAVLGVPGVGLLLMLNWLAG